MESGTCLMLMLLLLLVASVSIATANPNKRNLLGDNENNYAPVWKRSDERLNLIIKHEDTRVELKCLAEGHPSPKGEWYKDGLPMATDKDQTYQFKQKAQILIFPRLAMSDKGRYMCVISNSEGSLNWTFTLKVIYNIPLMKPYILKDPGNQTIETGDTLRIDCAIISSSAFHVQWLKHYMVNGTYKMPDGTFYITTLQTTAYPTKEKDNNTTSDSREIDKNIDDDTLIKHNVTVADSGRYTCVAANAEGYTYKSAWITVLPIPPDTVMMPVTSERTSQVVFIVIVVIVSVLSAIGLCVCIYCVLQRRRQSKCRHPTSITLKRNPFYPDMPPGLDIQVECDPLWEVPRASVELGDLLGEGEFGQVVKGYAISLWGRMQPTVVAVKMLKADAGEKEMLDLIKEMQVMKGIGHHKNIINLLGCCTQDNGPLWVMVEFAPYGNLRDFLRSKRARPQRESTSDYMRPEQTVTSLTGKDLISFSFQIARGMEYLTSKKILHRDLAARNVLVAEDYVLKIADFGLTRNVSDNNNYYFKFTDGRLPVKWMSPEALHERKYSSKSDIWSFAVMLWEMFTFGGNPYPTIAVENLFRLLRDGHRMEKPPYATREMYNIMLNCWEFDPHERPEFTDLVNILDKMLEDSMDTEYLSLQPQDLPDDEEVIPDLLEEEEDDNVFEPPKFTRPATQARRSDSQYGSLEGSEDNSSDVQSLDGERCTVYAQIQSDVPQYPPPHLAQCPPPTECTQDYTVPITNYTLDSYPAIDSYSVTDTYSAPAIETYPAPVGNYVPSENLFLSTSQDNLTEPSESTHFLPAVHNVRCRPPAHDTDPSESPLCPRDCDPHRTRPRLSTVTSDDGDYFSDHELISEDDKRGQGDGEDARSDYLQQSLCEQSLCPKRAQEQSLLPHSAGQTLTYSNDKVECVTLY